MVVRSRRKRNGSSDVMIVFRCKRCLQFDNYCSVSISHIHLSAHLFLGQAVLTTLHHSDPPEVRKRRLTRTEHTRIRIARAPSTSIFRLPAYNFLPLSTSTMASKALTRAFPASLKEVRLHLCQSGSASEGARFVRDMCSSYQCLPLS